MWGKSLKELKAIFDEGDVAKASYRELQRSGWASLIGSGVLGLTDTGSLVWLPQDSTGRQPVIGQYDANIQNNTQGTAYASLAPVPSVGAMGITDMSKLSYLHTRMGFTEVQLSAGVLPNVSLVPAAPGYYGVLCLCGLMSDTPGTYQLTVQDEDDNDVDGGIGGRVDMVVSTAYVPEWEREPVAFWKVGRDNKALEVDISGGAGAEKIGIYYKYHYET